MAAINNFTEDWQQHSGSEVQAFIKAQLQANANKYGYINIPSAKQQDGFYHMYCYKSLTDYQNDPSSYVQDIQIPISTDQGVSYSARLTASVATTNPIVAVDKAYTVGLRFSGIMNDNGDVSNAGEMGTIIFQKSVDGGVTWETVGTTTIQSRDTDDTGFDTYDIGQYFGDTNPQQIRARVSFNVTDDGGNVIATATSAPVTWSNITYTRLAIEFATDYAQAIVAANATEGLPLAYKLSGEVARKLHIRITGGTSTYENYFNIGANEYTNDLSTWNGYAADDSNTYGLLSHGVRTIEAWLTCSNGTTADAIESEHITNQVMVDAGTDTTPRLLIEDLQLNVKNYVPVNPLFSWAVWAPGVETVPVSFTLENYAGDESYFEEQYNAVPGTRYNQNATVEIEDSVTDTLYAYLGWSVNNVASATRTAITVDNTDKYAATPGAAWVLNPKTRNNSGKNGTSADNTEIIDGATAHFTGFSWLNDGAVLPDGWITAEDGQRVLRVPAGRTVTIDYDWLSPFRNNRLANVTLELDFKVRNITNETAPIFQALEEYGSTAGYIGVKMMPLESFIMTAVKLSSEAQDFRWQEDEREHIAINIVSELRSSTEQGSQALPLCRVFINGKINREFEFDTTQNGEWWRTGSNIVIGQEAADIDIYGIRVYHKELNNSQIFNDYISTVPDAATKSALRSENDILDGAGRVSKDKCQQKKVNTLTWHGVQPTHELTAEQSGWWELHAYDTNGDEDLEHSGTICKETKSLVASRQGTTANTYYYSNIQTKLKDVSGAFEEEVKAAWIACGLGTATEAANKKTRAMAAELPYSNAGTGSCTHGIWVLVADIHEDFTDYVASGSRSGYAFVSDGWIDGNGKYRGAQYKSAAGVPYATKLVGKINYASSMQSHLMAACRLYNDLHTRIVGYNSMQTAANGCRVAKYQELFLYFTQANDAATPMFQGPITFGAGKMDDPTWGYKKSDHPMFCMIEGADNNKALTDMRVPWQSNRITVKVKSGEVDGYIYNGETNLNMDRCKTVSRDFYVLDGSNNRIVQTLKGPSVDVENKIKEFINWIYYHDPSIKVFVGPWSGSNGFVRSASEPLWRKCKVWCTSGDDAYKLRRYDEVDAAWVEAGWDAENEQVAVLDLNTSETYASIVSANSGDWDAINAGIINAIAQEARTSLAGNNAIINAASLRFHYCFTNQFLAGTDNCSKNTYYTLDPGTLQWFFSQDDMDTILATDNSGFQSKPYYIDRQNPCAYGSTDSLYEGGGNALFNLCEAMYEGTGELREMMRSILSGMSALVSVNDNIPQVERDKRPTPWGAMWKYFFSTQVRIPAVAYNETARIRYEYPKSLGFVSDRGVNPISQSMGDQLESELQFMKRRLVLMASYAEWGEFSVSGASSGNIGLSDVANNLGFEGTTDVNDQTAAINFVGLKPHQWLWPGGKNGQTNKPLRQRCAPGVPVNLNLGTVDGDTACALYCSNYYRSFGNLGDLSVKESRNFEVVAKRLTDFNAIPTDADEPNFRPASLVLTNVPLLENISLRNSSLLGGTVNLSNSTRLKTVDLYGCDGVNSVILPKTATLTSVKLGRYINTLSLVDCTSLTTLEIQGYSRLSSVTIRNTPLANSLEVLRNANSMGAPLHDVNIDDINWTIDGQEGLSLVNKLASIAANSRLQGTITLTGVAVDFETKRRWVEAWGDVDHGTNGLTIVYPLVYVENVEIITGKYLSSVGDHQLEMSSSGNDFTSIVWSMPETEFAKINSATGAVTVKQLGTESSPPSSLVTVSITKRDGTTVTAEKRFYFHEHSCKLGDLVYADGSFSDEYLSAKTVVGVCFYINPNDPTDRLAVGLSNLAAGPWGLYNNSSNGVANVTLDNDSNATKCYDVQQLPNLTSNGAGSVTEANMRDSNQPDGFKKYTYGASAMGDWGLVGPCPADFGPIANKTVHAGQYNTQLIIRQRKMVLEGVTIDGFNQAAYYPFFISEDSPESNQLEYAMTAIGQAKNGNYKQFYWPPASRCYAYEPAVKPGEVLSDKFKAHMWWLPSCGELARIYYWDRVEPNNANAQNIFGFAKSAAGGAKFSGLGNSAYYWSSTEYSATGAWLIFASNGNIYTNSKNNSYSVRAVVAF
jgi:hypothetical protein